MSIDGDTVGVRDASGWVGWTLADEARVRVGVVGSVLVTIGLAVLLATSLQLVPFVLLSATGLVLTACLFVRPVPAALRERGVSGEDLWAVLVAILSPALVGGLVTLGVDAPVKPFAGHFALLLLAAAILPPPRLRVPLAAWQIVVWLTIVLLGGQRDPAVLLLHLGGAFLLGLVLMRTAEALSVSYDDAHAVRTAAERRAELLSSLLRTHDLDPEVVLRTVADGLMSLGFDVAAIRTVDRARGVARIVEGVARDELEVVEELPLDAPELALVARTGAPAVLEPGERAPGRPGDRTLHTAAYFPVFEDGEIVAVVTAGTAERAPGDEAVDAAELLVAQAGVALQRARTYRQDRATTEQLQQLEQRTQDFISTVSHELRTPLTVVQGLTTTLEERWSDLDGRRRDDLLRRIDSNAERLATMVTRLLDTSQFTRGGLKLTPAEVRLGPWLDAALDRLGEVLADHRVEVDVAQDVVISVDQELFEHVTDNLLVNLARHTPPGTPARLRAVVVGDRVEVELEDDGPGIAAQDLPHVLERFYRGGDRSHRVSTRGLGLGLALAAEVVRAHGGQLTVGASASGGARFRFDVPLATQR